MRLSRILPSGDVIRYGIALLASATALLFVWPGLFQNLLATRGATEAFMPHQHCYQFIPELVWLHLSSDTLIGLSYVAISLTLAYLVYRARRDIPFHWVFLAFGLFIIACGGTHFMEVWTTYNATYWLSGYVKLVTAVASVATALVLPPLVPKTLALVQSAKLSEERRLKLEKAQEELLALYDKVKEIDQLQTQFFANVSQELRKPLAITLGPVEGLLAPEPLAQQSLRGAKALREGMPGHEVEKLARESATRKVELQAILDRLRESEAHYRSLADAMPQIVWTADGDGYLDYYNRRWFEYTGLTAELTLGWGWQIVLHPEDKERCIRRWAKSVKTGEDYEVEYRFKRADGAYRWHLGRALPMRNEAGQVVRWFGTSTDIHEQKLVAKERDELLSRESEARRMAEAATRRLEGVQLITEAALAHLTINNMMDEMLTRVRDMLRVDTTAILLVEEEGSELVAWAAKGLEEEVELGIRIPIGKGFAGRIVAEQRPIIIDDLERADVFNPLLREKGIKSLLGVPLVVEGRSIGVIHIGTFEPRLFTEDDTRLLQLIADRIALASDHARLYEVERRARAEAEEANRAKDEFLAVVSHELRTPLTPIIGWVHMMRGGLLGPRELEHGLAVIDKNSYALTRLINDLLDMSAILSGKMHIERAPVPLASTVIEAVETVRAEAARRSIEIEVSPLTTDVETLTVSGDRTRLVQVFWNLLYNAVKFSEPRTRVRLRLEADEREARVHVEDEGQGISPDFLPFIFERFRQADASKSRPHGGLGLGLALVKSFVEAHGGSVEAASPGLGRGSRFTVRLPRLQPQGLTVTQLGANAPAAPPARDEGRVRLLVVEDALDTLNMLQVAFELQGYEVTLCETPAEALRVAVSMWFDIVISDIGMPEIDGYELLRRLRELPHLRDVPAVALTGYAAKADEEAAFKAGFDAHIAKPIEPAELAARIEQLLKGRTPRRQL